MTGTACTRGVPLDTLVEYWADRGTTDEALEEHVFACAACSARLGWLAALEAAMPGAVERRGGRRMSLTADAVEHLRRRGVRLREYHFTSNREVACTVALDDDLVVSWIPVDLADDEALSGALVTPDDREVARFDDAPIDRTRRMFVMVAAAEELLRLPDIRLRLRLTASGPRGARDLDELVFDHTAPR